MIRLTSLLSATSAQLGESVVDYILFANRRLLRFCRLLYRSVLPEQGTQPKTGVPNAPQDYIPSMMNVLQITCRHSGSPLTRLKAP
jgi:hypothetical protein